ERKLDRRGVAASRTVDRRRWVNKVNGRRIGRGLKLVLVPPAQLGPAGQGHATAFWPCDNRLQDDHREPPPGTPTAPSSRRCNTHTIVKRSNASRSSTAQRDFNSWAVGLRNKAKTPFMRCIIPRCSLRSEMDRSVFNARTGWRGRPSRPYIANASSTSSEP